MRTRRSLSVNVSRFCGVALALFCVAASAQAPIIDASQPVSGSSTRGKAAPAVATASGGSSVSDLYLQLQSLQQEVMDLRGIVEEQRHQIDTLRQQNLDRYTDLDKRLSQLQGGGASVATAQPQQNSDSSPVVAVPVAAPVASTPAPTAATMETAKPEEYEAYQQAYAKLKGQDFPGAIKTFNVFIASYPSSSLAPNAYYWLGKAYLQPPQDLNKAQQAFAKVVNDHPQHNKAPDALYELGKVYFLKGDKPKAKALLQQVIDNYGSSGSSAPQFAKQFLDQNFRK